MMQKEWLTINWKDGIGFLNCSKDLQVNYDKAYFQKYMEYAKTDKGRLITEERVKFLKWAMQDYPSYSVLDVGIGCGDFLQTISSDLPEVAGIDVCEEANYWLHQRDMLAKPQPYDVMTFWDSLEHIVHPQNLIRQYKPTYVLVSLPIFKDTHHLFASKHFRIGEHCWYFTKEGFVQWMRRGLDMYCVSMQHFESSKCGREDIMSFAFKKRAAGEEVTVDWEFCPIVADGSHVAKGYRCPKCGIVNPTKQCKACSYS